MLGIVSCLFFSRPVWLFHIYNPATFPTVIIKTRFPLVGEIQKINYRTNVVDKSDLQYVVLGI
jgi:hypothetical protein